MDFWTAVKYVLAVIAIMAVAGGIVYFLSGVVINVFEKKNKTEQPKEAKPVESKEQTLLLEDSKEILEQPVLEAQEVEGETVNLDLAEEEERQINAQRNELAERARVVEEAQNQPEEDEEIEDEDINDIYQRMIAEINAEALQQNGEQTEDVDDEELEDDEDLISEEDLDKFIGEINEDEDDVFGIEELDNEEVSEDVDSEELEEVNEEVNEIVEEPAKEEIIEEQTEEQEEVVEEAVTQVDEEKEDLKKLVEELKQQLEKEQQEKAQLIAQEKEVEVVDGESVESLTNRLEVLTERLAQSEKELKANKKEFLPLLKIKKNLENDKAKLRRKEAMVAKQKVVLFGVNNYVVDPEKEKKLSEDLDVLDALRLSVQHCEEVIKANEDRYPILEKTNNILTRQIEDLKSDIADIQARIDAKNNANND